MHTPTGTKADSLYTLIRDKICLLDYAPGMSLREEALAKEYDVSRTPIRRVLIGLEHDGLVTYQPGAGFTVTTIDVKSLKEVYEFRLKIAEFVGELMTPHFPEEDITALEDVLEQVWAMMDRYEPRKLGELYHQFNAIVNRNINNRPLRKTSDNLFHQTARVWLDLLPDFDWEEEVRIMAEEIESVIEAAKADDMVAVGTIRRDHMVWLLNRINSYMSSANPDE